MSKKLSLLVCLASLMVAFFGCSNEKVAGTVTDTGNTIAESQVTGVVLRVDGTPAADAMVRMARMAVFDSVLHVPEKIEVLTDSNGVYAFDSALSDTEQLYCSVIRGFVYYCQSLIIFSLLQVVLFSLLLKRIHKISYLIKESNATE